MRRTGTTDSAFRLLILTTTVGRTFMLRATVRRAFCIGTIMTERSPMWRWWRALRSTKTEKNKREWALPLAITTATGGWIFSKQIFLTIPRRSIATTATELLTM